VANSITPDSRSPQACTLHLRKGSAKPLHGGHPWVFADAIARVEGEAKPGDDVRVVDDRGSFLGRGLYSPDSAIAVRLLTRADKALDHALLESRIDEAIRLRRDVLKLGAPEAPEEVAVVAVRQKEVTLSAADERLLKEIDLQIFKIQNFAAQYGMDALEETADLRRKRDDLLKRAGVTPTASGRMPKLAQMAPEIPQTNAYRLINSEGDGLGGLTVDVYGDCLAVQFGTVGMDKRSAFILDLLEKKVKPKAIFDRGDARSRQLEKLEPPQSGVLRGKSPDGPLTVYENGVRLSCDLRSGFGQKTGLYLDQRENRRRFAELAAGRNVLDAFCYSGGFSLHAARAGARSLTLLDSSEEALELAKVNLEANHIEDADLIHAGWSEGFKHLREAGKQFDLMVVDPPKFTRNKESLNEALSGYRDLNQQAVRLLAPGGLLFTCSCSGNVSETEFERAVAAGLRASDRRAVLLERRGAACDHPVPPGFDQGKYLKCLVLQII